MRLTIIVLLGWFLTVEHVVAKKKANGKLCSKNSKCVSRNCCGVWPFKICRECCKNDDCPGKDICEGRVCVDYLPNGGKCGKNGDCKSGNCCGVWPAKSCRECCKDKDCPSGKTCTDRTCVAATTGNGGGCTSDKDCTSNACCGVWPWKKCRDCCKDSDCQGRAECEHNHCHAPSAGGGAPSAGGGAGGGRGGGGGGGGGPIDVNHL